MNTWIRSTRSMSTGNNVVPAFKAARSGGLWAGPLVAALAILPQLDGTPNWLLVGATGLLGLIPVAASINAFCQPRSFVAMNTLLELTLAPIFIMLCMSMWSILPKFPVQWAFAKEYWYLYVIVVGGLSALAFRNARGRWPRKCRALEELLQHGTLGREAVHRFFSSSQMSPESPVTRPVNSSIIFGASIIVPAMIAIVGRGGLFVFLSFVSSALVAYFLTTMLVRHFYMRRALSMRPVLQESPV